MKRPQSDIYFAGDDAHTFLPWIVGIMACMATLLLCLGITVSGWVVDRSGAYANSFTVNIPSNIDSLPDKITDVLTTLQKMPDVTNVTQVTEEKLRDMLKPWLGNSEAVEALPLPIVFDVTLKENASINYPSVQATLANIAEGTEVDAHEIWVANFMNFSAATRSLLAILATLIVGGLALMIAFTSRASLKLHARTVSLLHSIGAEDDYIIRQFQNEAFLVTLRGTVPGCIAAGIAYWISGIYMTSLQSSVLPAFAMSGSHALLLVLMPLACGAVAWVAAHFSVVNQLQRVL